MSEKTIREASSTKFHKKHTRKFTNGIIIGTLSLLLSFLLIFDKIEVRSVTRLIMIPIFLASGILGVIDVLIEDLFYMKKKDFKIKRNSIVLPNPSRKDILSSKEANPYSIPYLSIKQINKDKEVTLKMKLRGEKEPRKVCIIEKKNGDKIKLRPDYFKDDFDSFVDTLIKVYNQNKE